MRQVVTHTASTFHELNLLLVNLDDAAVRVRLAVKTNNKTVGQRAYLIVVADARHRTPLRNNIFEFVEKAKYLLHTHRVGIIAFDACNFRSDAMVHVGRRFFKNVAKRILERILRHPDFGSQLVAAKIFKRGIVSLFVGIIFLFHSLIRFLRLQNSQNK